MKKAKIYIPSKTAMQSGRGKQKNWILEFDTKDSKINPLMGWESSTDTLGEVILKFSSIGMLKSTRIPTVLILLKLISDKLFIFIHNFLIILQ